MDFSISAWGTALEHDTANGLYNKVLKIDDTHFFAVYQSTSSRGVAVVFTLNASTGAITETSSLQFESNNFLWPDIVQLNSTDFICAYTGFDNDGFAILLRVNLSTWAITTPGSAYEFDTSNGQTNALSIVDSTHVVVAYSGTTNQGKAKTLEIDTSTGAITAVGTDVTFYTGFTWHIQAKALADVGYGTHHFLSWRGADNDGFCGVISVDASTYNVTFLSTALEYDTTNAETQSIIRLSQYRYVIVYNANVGLGQKVIAVDSSTYATTIERYDSVYNSSGTGYGHVNATVLKQDASGDFIVGIANSSGSTGIMQIYRMFPDGAMMRMSSLFTFESTAVAQFNSLVAVDDDHFINMWGGSGSDGFIQSFNLTEEDHVAPRARPIRTYTYESGSGGYLAVHTLSGIDTTGSNTMVILNIYNRNFSDISSTPDINGTSFTLVDSQYNTNVAGVAQYRAFISSSSATVTVPTSGFKLMAFDVQVWENVDQTTPILSTAKSSISGLNTAASTAIGGTSDKKDTFLVVAGLQGNPAQSLSANYIGGTSTITNFDHADSNLGRALAGYTFIRDSVNDFIGLQWSTSTQACFIKTEIASAVPTSAQTVEMNAISSTATLYNMTVAQTALNVEMNAINATATLYEMAVTTGAVAVSMGTISAPVTLYNQTVVTGAVAVSMEAISAPVTLYPSVVSPASVAVGMQAINATATLYEMLVSAGATSVLMNAIDSTATLYPMGATTGAVSVSMNHIDATVTLYNMTVTGGVTALPRKRVYKYNPFTDEFDIASLTQAVNQLTADTTITKLYDIVLIDASSGNVTITPPSASSYPAGVFTYKRIDSTGNTVTIGATVDGVTNPTLSSLEVMKTVSDGTSWYEI